MLIVISMGIASAQSGMFHFIKDIVDNDMNPLDADDDGIVDYTNKAYSCSADEVCDDDEDICKTASETPSIILDPPSLFQSRWIPLIAFLDIIGSNTNFEDSRSVVSFNPVNTVFPFPPRVKDEENISMLIFIMPLWFTRPLDVPIEVTVTTGEEEVSGGMDIRAVPFPWDM